MPAGDGPSGPPEATYLGHYLSLEVKPEILFAGFSTANRRAIRKAERAGLAVRFSTSRESMAHFVRLHALTRKRHGAPIQPALFFRALHHEMIEKGRGLVAVAEASGTPVAAAVFLRFGDSAVYKFGASDPAAWEARPNNLVMWEAIQFLARSGCRFLHLGRTDRHQVGLQRFKTSWGASEEPIYYTRYHPAAERWDPVAAPTPGLASALLKRLPIPLNRLAGSLAYRFLAS